MWINVLIICQSGESRCAHTDYDRGMPLCVLYSIIKNEFVSSNQIFYNKYDLFINSIIERVLTCLWLYANWYQFFSPVEHEFIAIIIIFQLFLHNNIIGYYVNIAYFSCSPFISSVQTYQFMNRQITSAFINWWKLVCAIEWLDMIIILQYSISLCVWFQLTFKYLLHSANMYYQILFCMRYQY